MKTMTVAEILEKVQPYDTPEKWHDDVDLESMAQTLGIHNPEYSMTDEMRTIWHTRVQQRYIQTWICTDTAVGTSVIFLDRKPIALARQSARKSDEEIYFFSVSGGDAIRELMLSFYIPNGFPLITPDTIVEFSESFPIVFDERPVPGRDDRYDY